MRILIAPDSYKECLSALRVAECMRDGLALSLHDTEFILRPMADGGEGTVDALVHGLNGKKVEISTVDMFRRPITTYYGELDSKTAVIEVANIIGMEVSRERNPYMASSFGVGDVICKLYARGFRKIYVGLGGSLTNDGGAGVLEALGLNFVNHNGFRFDVNGGNLSDIATVEGSLMDGINDLDIQLICDVDNPLCGKHGATYTYGKQKGVTEQAMPEFETAINDFALMVSDYLNIDMQNTPGAGAAGGIGFGLLCSGSTLVPGAEFVADIVLSDLNLTTIDYVFTGEGKSDFQTKFGKLPVCVAKRINKNGGKSILISGGLGTDYLELFEYFLSMHSITDGPMSLDDAITNAPSLIMNTCRNIGRLVQ
ncbi:glycerate kinase [Macrococcus equi]|uniref:glycerate kinase n=1 Tax=Macrococcus equi TaxID=3395462 RepID=UPI0039BE0474